MGKSLCYIYPAMCHRVRESAAATEVLTMSKVCEICGKHAVAGRSVSHSHRVVNRKFKPNIQHVSVVVDGHRQKMNVCTTCLKSGKGARS